MSEVSMGPGWWQASDGKWYPPEQHPDFRPAAVIQSPIPLPQEYLSGQAMPTQWTSQGYSTYEVPPTYGAPPSWPINQPINQPFPQPFSQPFPQPLGGNLSTTSPDTAKPIIKRPGFQISAVILVVVLVGAMLFVVFGKSSNSNGAHAIASAMAADLNSGNYQQVCLLAVPNQQAACKANLASALSQGVRFINISLGTVTVNGTQALFVLTGTFCDSTSKCLSNSDPNAATDSGQTFAQVYASALSTTASNPFIAPLVEENGKWYLTGF